jgi:hypothetical protein
MSYLVLRTRYPQLSARRLFSKHKEFVGFIEGDDSITKCDHIDLEIVRKLGVKFKLEAHPNFTRASFCGNVLPTVHSRFIVADPLKPICNLFLTPQRYMQRKIGIRLGLLRARALSGLFIHRDTPMLTVLYQAVLKRTRSYDPIHDMDDRYHEARHHDALHWYNSNKPYLHGYTSVTPESRIAVAELYGFDAEYQLAFERACQKWADGEDVVFPTHPRIEKQALDNASMLSSDPVLIERRIWRPVNQLPDPFIPYTRDGEVVELSLRNYHPATGCYSKKFPASALDVKLCVLNP